MQIWPLVQQQSTAFVLFSENWNANATIILKYLWQLFVIFSWNYVQTSANTFLKSVLFDVIKISKNF